MHLGLGVSRISCEVCIMFLLVAAIQTLCPVMELRVHVSHDRRLLVHHILDNIHHY